jgi:hypothetical protein
MNSLPPLITPLAIIGIAVYLLMRRNGERARNAPLRREIEAQVCFETILYRASIFKIARFGDTRGQWIPLRGPKRLIVGTDAFMVSAPQTLREFAFRGRESSIAFSQMPSRLAARDWIVITGQAGGRQVQLAITRKGSMPEIWQALAETGAAPGPPPFVEALDSDHGQAHEHLDEARKVAVASTWQERNRGRRDLVTLDGRLQPVRPRPKIPLPAAALAVVAAVALTGLIASGTLIFDRVGAYNADRIYLRAGHPIRVLLGPDHYVVYVGCTQDMACPRLPPSGLSVSPASGGILAASPDPSSDHLSGAQPFVGEVSFTVPVKEVVSLDLSAHLGQPAFVVPSEGEEAHALIGWIILAGLSLLVLLAAIVSLCVLLAWRLGFGGASVPGGRPNTEPGSGRASGAP